MLIRIADLVTRRTAALILAITLLAGVSAAVGDWATPIDTQVETLRSSMFRKPPSGDTILVAIDPKSMAELSSWPWPRSLHGRLVDRLTQAGAGHVVFDVVFADPSVDPSQDRAFAAAIRRANGRVVLPASLENADGQLGGRTESLPPEMLRRHAQIGSIWIRLDDDLQPRRLPYSVRIGGERRPAIATILANQPSRRDDTFPIDWSFDIDRFPTISYSDVLAGRFDPSFFRGRNVVVGSTSTTLGDHWTVPSHGRIPGVYIQAVGSETLRRHVPRPVGQWPAFAAIGLLIAFAAFIRRPAARLAALCGSVAAAVALPLLVREYTGVIAEPGAAVTAAVAAILASFGAQMTRAILARVTLAPISNLPNLTAMCLHSQTRAITVAVRLRNHVETNALLGSQGQGELLRRVADRIRLAASGAAVFQVDDHSFAWRTTDADTATSDALEGLHALLASGITVGERTVDVTIAVGISDDPALGTEEAVAAAMAAASRAERRGLSWTRYETDDDDDADWRLSLLNELDRAIDQGDVWVAYQPKCDLKSATICGAEALVRWRHPLRGEIRPDQFIPMLEDNGRIEKLTLHVLESAIRDFAPLDEALSVAINISARMIGRNRLSDPIREMLDRWGMAAHRLTLEITESAALAGSAGIEELNNLRAIGVHISIDDYGTGQSTLSYLKTLPATELKIDRSFVQVIATSRSDAAVVDSTVKLAHALGLIVVAEGVESEEVLNLLRQMNCDMVQGYYIGEPGSIRTFVERLSLPNPLRAGRRH